ncbi:RnfABCDGE type electron transport complex subunit E [Fusobacterium sp.]|uniref:RnfABCDGE type electron transport complex subunit E n=1 Tax=Fusobacterium sp. TaxID=68766 RepID=UPI0026068EF1|nr:electron transport complex subunit E [Fusobacterium sp.]
MAKSKLGIVINGIIKENPVLVLLLGLCPTLGTSTSAINGMSMGLATTAVLICSNTIISIIKKAIPDKVRIPAFIMVIASLVTVVQMLMEAYVPDIYKVLGLYIPLIVVNCIVLGRAESFASKNSVIDSMFDGLGSGLGFTMALTILGIIREILGSGTIFDISIVPSFWQPALIFILPPGGFMTIACVIAYQNYLKQKKGA